MALLWHSIVNSDYQEMISVTAYASLLKVYENQLQPARKPHNRKHATGQATPRGDQ